MLSAKLLEKKDKLSSNDKNIQLFEFIPDSSKTQISPKNLKYLLVMGFVYKIYGNRKMPYDLVVMMAGYIANFNRIMTSKEQHRTLRIFFNTLHASPYNASTFFEGDDCSLFYQMRGAYNLVQRDTWTSETHNAVLSTITRLLRLSSEDSEYYHELDSEVCCPPVPVCPTIKKVQALYKSGGFNIRRDNFWKQPYIEQNETTEANDYNCCTIL